MLVRFKFFIENTNTVPQLRVSDMVEVVEGVLVSLESLLEVLLEKVAVTKGSPS